MSSLPDKRILTFLKKHHVLNLATCSGNIPWCANCFYVFDETIPGFIVTSDSETRHASEAIANNSVAGSVVLETAVIGKIRGVQFQGKMIKPSGKELSGAKKRYLLRFPVAMLMETEIWIIRTDLLKMTDNRLGFGKKLIWKADPGETVKTE